MDGDGWGREEEEGRGEESWRIELSRGRVGDGDGLKSCQDQGGASVLIVFLVVLVVLVGFFFFFFCLSVVWFRPSGLPCYTRTVNFVISNGTSRYHCP